jgi:glycosyltransferase involved in cell wall biosynthesis
MKIMWLTADPFVERSIGMTAPLEAARFLRSNGHEVLVLSGARRADEPLTDVPVVYIRSHYIPLLAWVSLWPGVGRELSRRGRDFDVVVTDPALLPPVMRWSRALRKRRLRVPKVLLEVRSPPVRAAKVRMIAQWARFLLTLRVYGKRVDALTATSEGLREFLVRVTRLPASKTLSWSGSGSRWCQGRPPDSPLPAELPMQTKDRFVILYVGSLTPGRGLAESLEAINLARRKAPDVLLVLLGGGSYLPQLRSMARDLRLGDHALFVDAVPHERVPEFIRSATVGLIPLPAFWIWQVSTPIKLAEYLCLGLPVVLTDIRAHHVVSRDARFSFWAPTSRPPDLASAILRAYGRRNEMPQLGQEAAEWASTRFSWAVQLSRFEAAVSSLVDTAERNGDGPTSG